jgi:hypothetical protein
MTFSRQYLWRVRPSGLERARRFGVIYSIHLQGQTQIAAPFWRFLGSITLQPWIWKDYIPPKSRAVSEIRYITAHKTAFFLLLYFKISRNRFIHNFLDSSFHEPPKWRYVNYVFNWETANKLITTAPHATKHTKTRWYSYSLANICRYSFLFR